MEAAPRRPRAKMEEAKMRRHQEGGGPNLESTLHRSSVAVTFTFKGSQRCAGARSHEFVVAIAFAQPPSTLPGTRTSFPETQTRVQRRVIAVLPHRSTRYSSSASKVLLL